MNEQEISGARQHVVRAVTLIADNDQDWYNAILAVAREAARDHMGTGMGRDEYEAMLNGRAQAGSDRADYARVVGSAVAEKLTELVDDACADVPSIVAMLLIDVLDLGDGAQADLFGEHYLPESADDIEWEGEDDDELTGPTWGDHVNDLGDWCPWSLCWAPDGTEEGDLCPAGCKASTVVPTAE